MNDTSNLLLGDLLKVQYKCYTKYLVMCSYICYLVTILLIILERYNSQEQQCMEMRIVTADLSGDLEFETIVLIILHSNSSSMKREV